MITIKEEIAEWNTLLEMVEFKPVQNKKLPELKSIIMTGGLIYIKDNLFWCSPSHYDSLKDRQERRYFLLDAEDYLQEDVVGPMLRQTDRGIKYE